jgi:hypothetical protein
MACASDVFVPGVRLLVVVTVIMAALSIGTKAVNDRMQMNVRHFFIGLWSAVGGIRKRRRTRDANPRLAAGEFIRPFPFPLVTELRHLLSGFNAKVDPVCFAAYSSTTSIFRTDLPMKISDLKPCKMHGEGVHFATRTNARPIQNQ